MICPKCKKEIDCLDYDVTATCKSQLTLDGACDETYDSDALQQNVEFDNFCCPHCDEVLAFSEEEAIKFLKGEK